VKGLSPLGVASKVSCASLRLWEACRRQYKQAAPHGAIYMAL
jgi:hypothetical protein